MIYWQTEWLTARLSYFTHSLSIYLADWLAGSLAIMIDWINWNFLFTRATKHKAPTHRLSTNDRQAEREAKETNELLSNWTVLTTSQPSNKPNLCPKRLKCESSKHVFKSMCSIYFILASGLIAAACSSVDWIVCRQGTLDNYQWRRVSQQSVFPC